MKALLKALRDRRELAVARPEEGAAVNRIWLLSEIVRVLAAAGVYSTFTLVGLNALRGGGLPYLWMVPWGRVW